jgi:hypothetical protein
MDALAELQKTRLALLLYIRPMDALNQIRALDALGAHVSAKTAADFAGSFPGNAAFPQLAAAEKTFRALDLENGIPLEDELASMAFKAILSRIDGGAYSRLLKDEESILSTQYPAAFKEVFSRLNGAYNQFLENEEQILREEILRIVTERREPQAVQLWGGFSDEPPAFPPNQRWNFSHFNSSYDPLGAFYGYPDTRDFQYIETIPAQDGLEALILAGRSIPRTALQGIIRKAKYSASGQLLSLAIDTGDSYEHIAADYYALAHCCLLLALFMLMGIITIRLKTAAPRGSVPPPAT